MPWQKPAQAAEMSKAAGRLVASMMSPPTFSKSTSMPLGVAAASWVAQSSARWSTAASKPSRSVSSAHFSAPPAIPTTRAPSDLASWPATEPTAPAAAETTTVSPGCGLPMSRIPIVD